MMFDMSKEEGEELAPGMATVVFEDALPEEAELDSGDPAELELGYEETGGPATSAFIGTAEGRETLLTLLTGMMSVPGPGETRAAGTQPATSTSGPVSVAGDWVPYARTSSQNLVGKGLTTAAGSSGVAAALGGRPTPIVAPVVTQTTAAGNQVAPTRVRLLGRSAQTSCYRRSPVVDMLNGPSGPKGSSSQRSRCRHLQYSSQGLRRCKRLCPKFRQLLRSLRLNRG
ncbi:hypothetical protein PC114_g12305 [Phytophthora cactorum]|nr:hypothetical protein PC114_g12305 [Phytophthora cactorum]